MKKIKFALLLNDKPCRSLEDIRENFDAEDIIKNFDNGVLLKWLKIYNLDELYNKALLIDKNSENKLHHLLDLFFEDEAKKEELINKYKEEKESKIKEEKQRVKEEKRLEAENKKRLDEEHKKNYEYVVKSIIKNKKDYGFVKKSIYENNKILMENYSDFFEKLKSGKCLFGILSVLANEDTRNYFLNDRNIMNSIKYNVIKGIDRTLIVDINKNYKLDYKNINLLVANGAKNLFSLISYAPLSIFGEKYGGLPSALRSSSNETTKYDYIFNKIEIYQEVNNRENVFITLVKNKKCLILHINSDMTIRSSEDKNKLYTYKDIDNKFLILNGIDYKSSGKVSDLVYMEI